MDSGCHNTAVYFSVLLGCGAASLSDCCPTSCDNIVVSFSKVKFPKNVLDIYPSFAVLLEAPA
jgi:hypothetical protein